MRVVNIIPDQMKKLAGAAQVWSEFTDQGQGFRGPYQDLVLPVTLHFNGSVGREPAVRRMGLVSDALAGKSVLDIGCNAGHNSILAWLNGAEFVHGIDESAPAIRVAQKIRGALGANVRFSKVSIERFVPDQTYQTVLFFSVWAHIKAREQALKAIAATEFESLFWETHALEQYPHSEQELNVICHRMDWEPPQKIGRYETRPGETRELYIVR